MSAQSELLMQTQAVMHVLRHASSEGISSGDIAIDIAGLSPSDVNLILSDLEKHHLVAKSGYAPILWSLVGSTDCTVSMSPSKQSHKTLNGFSHAEKIPIPSPKQAQYFETSKDSYFNQNGQNNFLTSEAYTTLTAAILASCSISTTTTTPGDVRPYVNVIESNLVNVLQQCGSLSVHEIKTKLDFRDEATLRFILQKLLERNVIVKDGDQRWRLAGSTRTNVGVIGEGRKRRSPVQSEGCEISRNRTPTPPKENNHRVQNGYMHTAASIVSNGFLMTSVSPPTENGVPNGFHVSAISPKENGNCARIPNGFRNSKTFLPKNGYMEADKRNGFWQSMNNDEMNAKVTQSSHNKQHNRSSPPLSLKTETSEVLDDLTVTTPKSYHKELYQIAMQEDTICYLPCGTGKDLVMAQVIAHMAILNRTKHALVIVPDIVSALNVAQVLRKELGSKNKRKKLNVALHAGQLKQSIGKVEVVVITSTSCLGLLNCGALSWKDVCLLIFDNSVMCCNDEASKKILLQYYLKAKMDFRDGHVPKLLSFLDSSAGQENLEETKRAFNEVLSTMGDVCLSCVSESIQELQEHKREAMFVCVQTGFNEEELRMLFLLVYYLKLVFDNLAAQWQPLNSYRELLKMSLRESSVMSDAFAKLIHLTGQPPEKRLPQSCLKTWRHYLAICEVIFSLVECGEDLAKELLVNLTREPFGFAWANDVGLPGFELSRQLMEKDISNLGFNLSNPRGSGLRELLDQLMIIRWENARVSSERPLALVIVKLNKTANMLANYLARCPQLMKRNVKTTFVDGSRSHQQKAVISAIKRRQYQVIVSTDNIDEELPHCELVVLLDQPSSVHALEQLRTRRATNVVALYRDFDGEDKLKELLRREELAEKAITHIRAT
ncbi:endoribonuclease Dicer homolog 3a-like isoform X3 [Paramuricea clavata]|uniref:Endoribonuclease Dicer homolog 3a-like isoform X3 n=1 Tax=Paramuricea clavata TaxID=317549 RepID=A0A6S7GWZ1_PARCT|nr:endoribonuclease Dicer homolog 3a-like isoform X3 [Paramuricea clavata]